MVDSYAEVASLGRRGQVPYQFVSGCSEVQLNKCRKRSKIDLEMFAYM